jgi:anti-sigma B factor antagonist
METLGRRGLASSKPARLVPAGLALRSGNHRGGDVVHVHTRTPNAPDHLEIRVEDTSGCLVVRLAGEMDLASSPRLRETLLRLLNRTDLSVVIDLSALDFIDSTGLSALIAGARRATALGRDYALAAPQPRIRKVFDVTGIGQVIPVHDAIDNALP